MSMFMMGEQALWANLQASIDNNSNNNNDNNSNNNNDNNNNNNNNSNNNEERVMHSSCNNLEIMINDEADEVIKQLFDSLKIDIKIIWNRWKIVIMSSIMLICCIVNVIK